MYDAEILSVDLQAGTCVVRYRGYGNEEEQILDNLKHAPGRRSRPQKLSDPEGGSLADSMDWCGQRSDTSSHPAGSTHNRHTPNQRGGFSWPGGPPMQGFPSQFSFPGVPSFPNFTGPLPHSSVSIYLFSTVTIRPNQTEGKPHLNSGFTFGAYPGFTRMVPE